MLIVLSSSDTYGVGWVIAERLHWHIVPSCLPRDKKTESSWVSARAWIGEA